MKKASFVLAIIILCLLNFSCNSNKETIWILDSEHDLTQEQITKLDSLFKSHERKTTNEIALVTTRTFWPDTTIDSYCTNLFNKHGIGVKGKNNGVLIVFSETKHQVRIGTGYGTEKVLKNEVAKRIIDSLMIPCFKKGKSFDGLWEGSKAIVGFLERPENKIN